MKPKNTKTYLEICYRKRIYFWAFLFPLTLSFGLGSDLLKVRRRAPAKKALDLSLPFWKSLLPYIPTTPTRAKNPHKQVHISIGI